MIRGFAVALVLSIVLAASVSAQTPAATIESTGFGSASAPVESAQIQILLGSSMAFGMGSMPMDMPDASASPVAAMPLDDMGMMSLSEARLQQVLDAIVGAGIDGLTSELSVPATTSMFGPGGPETGEIRLTIVRPDSAALTMLVEQAQRAAAEAGLTVLHLGARYDAADCAALVQQAREAAIADARQRADGLARGLGVTLGELIRATEYPYYGSTGSESCLPEGPDAMFGPYGPGTLPTFDPNAIEARTFAQVTLAFEFEPAA